MPSEFGEAPANERISLLGLAEIFPIEEAATEWFEKQVWSTGADLPGMRLHGCQRGPEPEAMPYWGGAVVLLGANGDGAAAVEGSASEVGVRDVHRDHQHEERVQHEAPGGVGPQEVE